MKALRLTTVGKAAELTDVDAPTVRPSDVLIDVASVSLASAELAVQREPVDENLEIPTELPITLGRYFAGRVVEVGSAVKDCAVGDVVVTAPPGSCGRCHPCLTGMDNYCVNPRAKTRLVPGISRDGGLAQQVAAPERLVLRIDGPSAEEAARASQFGLPAYHAIRVAKTMLAPGNHAVVIGGNARARYAMGILAEGIGCRVIAVTDDVAALRAHRTCYAETIIDSADANAQVIRDLVGGWGVDGVLDFVGSEASSAFAGSAATQGGAIVVAGSDGGFVPIGAGRLNRNGSARYVEGGSRGDLREVLDLLGNTKIAVDHTTISLASVVNAKDIDPDDVPVVVIP